MKIVIFYLIIFLNLSSSHAVQKNIDQNQIYKNLRCLVCQGQSISDSNCRDQWCGSSKSTSAISLEVLLSSCSRQTVSSFPSKQFTECFVSTWTSRLSYSYRCGVLRLSVITSSSSSLRRICPRISSRFSWIFRLRRYFRIRIWSCSTFARTCAFQSLFVAVTIAIVFSKRFCDVNLKTRRKRSHDSPIHSERGKFFRRGDWKRRNK